MNTKSIDFTQRNVAIDILRALTMLLMIFVNDLWTIKGEPAWLGHAESNQDFLGLADIVFPCFLFVVGMSIPFAIERRFSKGAPGVSTVGHILMRTFALLVMGVFIVNTESGVSHDTGFTLATYRILMVAGFFLVWNVYPTSDKPMKHLYTALKVLGVVLLVYLAIVFRDSNGGIFRARWWGILGLIGWTYFICAFIYLFTRDRLKYLISIWLFFILLCILKSGMLSGESLWKLPRGNFLDEILNILHIGNGALPAFTMGGIVLSLVSTKYINAANSKKVIFAVSAVIILLVAGFISHRFWIVSKIQATPPWIFYCTAAAVGTYAIIYWLVEKGKASWFNIIKPAGTATLTCYLVPYLTYSISSLLGIRLPEFLTTGFVGILNCVVYSFLVIGITYLLGRIHIKLKI
ncbi:MAG: DUF5009 domain-containing protein [Bacteroidales bacterium]|jgi:hypothetical protein|nr:DUF5009 domain-containing protein [Bacteroidales bacterium]